MQHPDEGTIHSWLDNALSAEETARVASHVSECAQCAAAVAEARGFIAASSRILTALDDVPRGVVPAVPAVPARKRDLRVLWRAAAAVLVVAGGSFVVMRDGGDEIRSSANSESVSAVSKRVAEAPAAAADGEAGVPAAAPVSDASGTTASSGTKRPAVALRAPVDLAAPTIARSNEEMQLSANVGSVQSAAAPLKELSAERTPGSRRILYQISAADTVILTEIEPLSLQSVVTTGVATARDLQQKTAGTRAVAPTRTEPKAVTAAAPPPPAPPADSRRVADTLVATEGAAMAQTAGAIRIRGSTSTTAQNTVRWVESETGKTLILSGKLPVEKLQEIRQRIEIERAAARKKTP
jgi:hypothetical protein